MTCAGQFVDALRARGCRITPQRQAILHILHETGSHLSAVEVYGRARDLLPGVTEPTVYRTLDFLTEHGLAYSTVRDGRLAYELASHAHHHAVCRVCGREVEIDDEDLSRMLHQLELSTGFSLERSHLNFSGVCASCR